MPTVRLLRPHQYPKNLLLFAAPGAAGTLDDGTTAWRALLGFVLFCLVSSAGYVANDLSDVEADRNHPRKRGRPIASGAVSPKAARVLLAALLVSAFVASPMLGGSFVLALAAYALLTFSYSLSMKHVPWFELLLVSTGFVVRAVAGGSATDTALSAWFLVVVSAGSLLVIAGKRLGELLTLGASASTRRVLAHYSVDSLRLLAAGAAALACAAYLAWALNGAGPRSDSGASDTALRLTTVPFVIAIGRYLVLSWRGKGEAPDIVVFRDPFMICAGIGWIGLYVAGLYA